MAFLQDLKVKKVSFVNRAANKRTFLLLKSDDQTREEKQEHEEESTMKDEIRKSVRLLLKSGTSDEKIVETLKTEYKLGEPEIEEVKASLDFARSLSAPDDVEKKNPKTKDPNDDEEDTETGAKKKPVKKEQTFATSDDLDAVRQENKELRETLQKTAETQRKGEISIWLSDNCAYLPADASKLVDDIYKMEKVDPEAAQRHKDALKQSSDMVKSSAVFVEKGSSFDSHPVPSGEILVKKVLEAKEAVRKSGDPNMKESDAIIAAIKSVPGAFNKYRTEHIRRSRVLG